MIEKFNDLPWHDAEINDIVIDRQLGGVQMRLRWPDYANSELVLIEFLDCYAFKCNMNFVVAPPDQILSAECLQNSPELNELRQRWGDVIDFSAIHCYRITTNSTNSEVKILAKSFQLKFLEK